MALRVTPNRLPPDGAADRFELHLWLRLRLLRRLLLRRLGAAVAAEQPLVEALVEASLRRRNLLNRALNRSSTGPPPGAAADWRTAATPLANPRLTLLGQGLLQALAPGTRTPSIRVCIIARLLALSAHRPAAQPPFRPSFGQFGRPPFRWRQPAALLLASPAPAVRPLRVSQRAASRVAGANRPRRRGFRLRLVETAEHPRHPEPDDDHPRQHCPILFAESASPARKLLLRLAQPAELPAGRKLLGLPVATLTPNQHYQLPPHHLQLPVASYSYQATSTSCTLPATSYSYSYSYSYTNHLASLPVASYSYHFSYQLQLPATSYQATKLPATSLPGYQATSTGFCALADIWSAASRVQPTNSSTSPA
uniref:Iroquois-class homeodomain protein IRX-5 n=1 Tax=Macrostomum lignano TaxID=282301 RepID=A0A1I8FDL6_9PLAT